MKKAFYLLLVTLLMVGCGGGGSAPTVSGISGDGGGGDISGPVGTITVTFPGAGSATSAPVLQNDNVTLIAPNTYPKEWGFRVTASKYETSQIVVGVIEGATPDDPGIPIYRTITTRTYFKSADNNVPGSITLKVPVDTGYNIEVVSFNDNVLDNVTSGKPRLFSSLQMIRYGHLDNVAVGPGANPTVSISLTPIGDNQIMFSHSGQITGGNAYTMKVTYKAKVPLRDTFNFADNTSNHFSMDNTAPYSIGVPFTRTAPVGTATDNIYFQGQFYINESMLSDAEQLAQSWKKYRLNAPAPYNLNNDIFQQLLLPGEVIVIIN